MIINQYILHSNYQTMYLAFISLKKKHKMLKIHNFVSFNIYTLTINVMKKKPNINLCHIHNPIHSFIYFYKCGHKIIRRSWAVNEAKETSITSTIDVTTSIPPTLKELAQGDIQISQIHDPSKYTMKEFETDWCINSQICDFQ